MFYPGLQNLFNIKTSVNDYIYGHIEGSGYGNGHECQHGNIHGDGNGDGYDYIFGFRNGDGSGDGYGTVDGNKEILVYQKLI